jgi:uncharacterized protein YndB with AHSA1/START domain
MTQPSLPDTTTQHRAPESESTVHADTTAGVVTAVIELPVPPARVFQALTDPGELERWWGAEDAYRTSDWKVDLRPGGEWSCVAVHRTSGQRSTVRGQYRIVEPPRLLVCTWCPSWEDFQETTIRYELEATPTGTRLRLTHDGFTGRPASCEGHRQGWLQVLGWLARYAADARCSGSR